MGTFYGAVEKWVIGMASYRIAKTEQDKKAANKKIEEGFSSMLSEKILDRQDKIAFWLIRELDEKDEQIKELKSRLSNIPQTNDF